MGVSELARWQWEGYVRYHQARSNLLLHIVLVPLFLLGNVALLVGLIRLSWFTALTGVISMFISISLQGRSHRAEVNPPEPFKSPLNTVSRIFLEQWFTFPRFVLSGAWLRTWRSAP